MTASKRNKALVALGAVVLVAALALTAIFTQPAGDRDKQGWNDNTPTPGQALTVEQSIRAAIPANPVMVVTTPDGQDWWDTITGFAPMLGLHDVPLTDAGIETTGYGYSMTRPLTTAISDATPGYGSAYIQTTSTDNADTLIGWLATQPGVADRRTYRTGQTVVIGPAWADTTEYPLDATATTATVGGDRQARPDRAEWEWALGSWADTLTEAAKPDRKDAITGFFTSLGVGSDTTVQVATTRPDRPWTGQVDGFSTNNVDLGALAGVLVSSQIPVEPTGDQPSEGPIGPVDPPASETPPDEPETPMDEPVPPTGSPGPTPEGDDSEDGPQFMLPGLRLFLMDGSGFALTTDGNKASLDGGVVGDPPEPLLPARTGKALLASFTPQTLTDYALDTSGNLPGPERITLHFGPDGQAALQPAAAAPVTPKETDPTAAPDITTPPTPAPEPTGPIIPDSERGDDPVTEDQSLNGTVTEPSDTMIGGGEPPPTGDFPGAPAPPTATSVPPSPPITID